MMNGCKNIGAILILLFAFSAISAQVKVRLTVNRDQILIGEPIALKVEAYMPLGTDIAWFPSDTIPRFPITYRSAVDTAENIDGKVISQSFVITSFDSGKQQLPPFEIFINGQPYYTDSIAIAVSYAPFDPKDDYKDIKDIIEIANRSVRYIPWLIAALAFISLIALIYFMLKQKKSPVREIVPTVPLLSAYDEAMMALKALAMQNPSEFELKSYYSELNDILRNYASRQFNISTFEKTNEEMILQLSDMNIPKDAFISLAQSLRMIDFVKFAKYRPTESDNRTNLETVKSSIELMDKNLVGAV